MDSEASSGKPIFENAPVGMFITNSSYIISRVNKAALGHLGHESAEFLKGKHLHEICDFEPLLSNFEQNNPHPAKVSQELVFFHKNGLSLPFVVIIAPYATDQIATEDYIWCLTDVSKYKKANEVLQSRLLETEAANSSKSFFLANISHSIRSHLNSIVGLSQLIKDKSIQYELPRDIDQYLKSIEFSSEQLQSLVNSILDLTAIEQGQITMIQPIVLQIELLMQSIFELFKERAGAKSLWFTYEIDNSVPEYIKTDKRILVQILMNLIDNAIKFTNDGNAVKVSVTTDSLYLIFKVSDEGVGMEESLLSRVFNLYDQVKSNENTGGQKVGMGLAIAKQLTGLIEGDISAFSKPGKGTTFILRIPLLEANEDATNLKSAVNKTQEFSSENKVLIIEDDQMNREVYQAWFEGFTFEIQYVTDGESGIQLAESFQPNLIITDIHLPGIDGISTIQKLRQIPCHQKTPIVVITASIFNEKRVMATKAGCNDYLVKPLNFNKLLSILNKYLKHNVTEEHSGVFYPPLKGIPEPLKTKLIQQYESLVRSPIYKLEKVVEEIGNIKMIFSNQGQTELSFLDLLENTAFEGDETKFRDLAQQAFLFYQQNLEAPEQVS